jgi:hypothetical protein
MTAVRLRKLRFTGTLPTKLAVERFPNWTLALDEEGLPGQDETTLRPGDDQEKISSDTIGTAVVVVGPDGKQQLGLLYGYLNLWRGPEHADWLHLFSGTRRLDIKLQANFWWPDETAPTLHYNDFAELPLRVKSVLPTAKSRKHLQLTLMPSGPVVYGLAAERARIVAPDELRIGSVPRGPRDHLADRAEACIYAIRRARRRVIGSTTGIATIAPRKNAIRVDYTYDKSDRHGKIHVTETVVFDARTIEARARSGVANGRRLNFALGRRGRPHLPSGTFGDIYSLLQSLDLSRGMRFVAPFFLMLFGEVRKIAFEVDAREAAPGHRGSSAWRIRSEMGGPHVEYTWLDTRTRVLLATRTTAPEAGFDELAIYER